MAKQYTLIIYLFNNYAGRLCSNITNIFQNFATEKTNVFSQNKQIVQKIDPNAQNQTLCETFTCFLLRNIKIYLKHIYENKSGL